MRTGALLGVAALAAFIYYCFARRGESAPRGLSAEPPQRARVGDGSASSPSPASAAATHTRFPEGDPTVRH